MEELKKLTKEEIEIIKIKKIKELKQIDKILSDLDNPLPKTRPMSDIIEDLPKFITTIEKNFVEIKNQEYVDDDFYYLVYELAIELIYKKEAWSFLNAF